MEHERRVFTLPSANDFMKVSPFHWKDLKLCYLYGKFTKYLEFRMREKWVTPKLRSCVGFLLDEFVNTVTFITVGNFELEKEQLNLSADTPSNIKLKSLSNVMEAKE
uniref:Uncharacterized protein n=1 Tax=Glossina pallidipes TaxID=7398 RepID=A0A1A9ZQ93_GLOPL